MNGYRIPMWTYIKLILTYWLVLPSFNGASQLYEKLVRPHIPNSDSVNIWFMPPKEEKDEHVQENDKERRVSWEDTSAKYIGHSAFDDDYGYYY
ncbi:unnamed protein product [Cochlearia groenlandica]